jgi:hypothetical protein
MYKQREENFITSYMYYIEHDAIIYKLKSFSCGLKVFYFFLYVYTYRNVQQKLF